MIHRFKLAAMITLVPLLILAQPARAAGDLLVAPTRLVLDGAAGGEVVVSNSGDKTNSYRISLVLRRMDASGQVKPTDEKLATPGEAAALEMINYAPRKITLAPGQSQTVRIGARPPADLAPGEYRAHLLFRAIPDATAAAPAGDAAAPVAEGMSIALTPIYGVTIPIIVRIGTIAGEAKLLSAKVESVGGHAGVMVDLGRAGQRSIYGALEVIAAGQSKPVALLKGIAAYPEVAERSVFIPLDQASLAVPRSTLSVRFVETDGIGKAMITQAPVH